MNYQQRLAFKRLMERLNLFRCSLCVEPLETYQDATIEHVWPRSLLAEHAPSKDNILLAHAHCNLAKKSRAPYPCELLLLSVVNTIIADTEKATPPEVAFNDGWSAWESGEFRYSNPYFGPYRSEWDLGWLKARRYAYPDSMDSPAPLDNFGALLPDKVAGDSRRPHYPAGRIARKLLCGVSMAAVAFQLLGWQR